MKKSKTHVALILDQSGSMSTTVAQAVQGYNEHVQQVKQNSQEQEILCYLITFNGQVYEHQWGVDAKELNEAATEDYVTNGSTSMRDAIGYTIDKLVKTTDTDDENNAYLVIIVSDGEENSSQHYTASALKERINSLQKTKRWTFSYMGCDEMYLKKVAADTSIPLANMAKWSNATPELATRGLNFNNARMDKYYKARLVGKTASANVYSDQAYCIADATNVDVVNMAVASSGFVASCATLNTTTNGAKAFNNYTPVNMNLNIVKG